MPEAPKLGLPAASDSDREDLDALLARLVSEDATTRDSAAREVLEAKPSWVSAIDHRVNSIADKTNRDDMRRVLEDVRTKGRTAERKKLEAAGKHGKIQTPDYLQLLAEYAQPKNKAWLDLVAIVALSRMLVQIGTVESARELIDMYSRFGEFLRVDIQLSLAKMGDKAVAALIEARRHKAEKVAKWSVRQLDALGKAIPSEAVQTEDPQVLADVLRAYGRVRDPDAARIVVSFSNSERAQVREAARQAIAMLGEVGNWQLRDSYEDLVGKKPPRDWSWDRTARELFGELDRQRLAQVYSLFDAGAKARSEGKLDAMREAWDKVLARSPLFEHRAEMAAGYLELAQKKQDDDRPLALAAARRAERLSTSDEEKNRAKSLALTLEGEELARQGVADQVLFNRALELDPHNSRAKDALGRLERGEVAKQSAFGRYAAAIAIGLSALFAIVLIGLRRGKRDEPEAKPDVDASTAEPETDDAGAAPDADVESQGPPDDVVQAERDARELEFERRADSQATALERDDEDGAAPEPEPEPDSEPDPD